MRRARSVESTSLIQTELASRTKPDLISRLKVVCLHEVQARSNDCVIQCPCLSHRRCPGCMCRGSSFVCTFRGWQRCKKYSRSPAAFILHSSNPSGCSHQLYSSSRSASSRCLLVSSSTLGHFSKASERRRRSPSHPERLCHHPLSSVF